MRRGRREECGKIPDSSGRQGSELCCLVSFLSQGVAWLELGFPRGNTGR